MDEKNLDDTNNSNQFQLVIASKNVHKIREIKSILNEIVP